LPHHGGKQVFSSMVIKCQTLRRLESHILLQVPDPIKNRLARPFRNIYTYSFSMNPVNVEPSGNLDFSQIQSDKTNIEVKLNTSPGSLVNIATKTYSLHMYYTGYQTFVFERGFMSLLIK
jgi:hypothetical protein